MPQQLDIFDDNRDVALRNDLAQALIACEPAAARRAADTLASEFGADPVLTPATRMIDHLLWQQAQAEGSGLGTAEVRDVRQQLDDTIAQAATAVLGRADAADWLAGQWCWLAERADGIAWSPSHADAHAAGLYLRGCAWHQAADAVARIASWRRIPLPLLWMAEARWRGDGADAGWPLLAEALWLAPARAAPLLLSLEDRDLRRLVDRFVERFGPSDKSPDTWSWLPAFALVDRPLLAGPLAAAAASSERAPTQAFQVLMALLRLERQGRHHELVAQRARLKSLSARLFEAYMSTR